MGPARIILPLATTVALFVGVAAQASSSSVTVKSGNGSVSSHSSASGSSSSATSSSSGSASTSAASSSSDAGGPASDEAIRTLLREQGYSDVEIVSRHGNSFTAKARKDGQPVTVEMSASGLGSDKTR